MRERSLSQSVPSLTTSSPRRARQAVLGGARLPRRRGARRAAALLAARQLPTLRALGRAPTAASLGAVVALLALASRRRPRAGRRPQTTTTLRRRRRRVRAARCGRRPRSPVSSSPSARRSCCSRPRRDGAPARAPAAAPRTRRVRARARACARARGPSGMSLAPLLPRAGTRAPTRSSRARGPPPRFLDAVADGAAPRRGRPAARVAVVRHQLAVPLRGVVAARAPPRTAAGAPRRRARARGRRSRGSRRTRSRSSTTCSRSSARSRPRRSRCLPALFCRRACAPAAAPARARRPLVGWGARVVGVASLLMVLGRRARSSTSPGTGGTTGAVRLPST